MAAPTYSAGSALFAATSLAAAKNAAVLIDLSTVIQGLVWVQVETGATAPTVGTTFALRRAIGSTATGKTTLSGSAASGQTSIGVNSASNIQKGTTLAILSASTKIGEIVAISSISGTTLTASTNLINSYSTSDLVFLVEDTASGGTIIPSNSGAWSASSSYSATLYPPIGVFVLHALNGDGTQTVNITAFNDEVPTLQ